MPKTALKPTLTLASTVQKKETVKKTPLLAVLILLFILGMIGSWLAKNWFLFSQPIHIAVSVPITGNRAADAQAILNGIRLRADEVNNEGGIHARKVVLDIYDDENKTETLPHIIDVIGHSKAIGAIGHYSNNLSLAAAHIYKQQQIPVITGNSTIDALTDDNPWYFRTIFNDADQLSLLANYSKKVLGLHTVHIIYDDDDVGRSLAEGFEDEAENVGLEIGKVWRYHYQDGDKTEFYKMLAQMHKDLKQRGTKIQNETVFMAVHSTQALDIVTSLRRLNTRMPLLGRTSLSSSNFLNLLKATPQEKNQPGYFSDDIYLTVPYLPALVTGDGQLFNDAYIKTYQQMPEANAALHYDAISLLLNTLAKMPANTLNLPIKTQRQKLRRALWKIASPQTAFKGVTGDIYFESNGDTIKNIPMGAFEKGQPNMALEQFVLVDDIKKVPNLLESALDENIIYMNKKFMRYIEVMYSGIHINAIGEFNEKDLTIPVDFYLWFRYKGKIRPNHVRFLHTTDTINIGKPISEKYNPETQESYQLYKVHGTFKADFLPDYLIRQRYFFDLSFRQLDFNVNELIVVADFEGMGLGAGQSFTTKLQKENVMNPHYGWVISDAWYEQTVSTDDKQQFTGPLNMQDTRAGKSQFGVLFEIEADKFSLRGNLSKNAALYTFSISLCLLLLYFISIRATQHVRLSQILWLPFSLLYFALLLSGEPLLMNWLLEQQNHIKINLEIVITFFDIAWWLVSAILLVTFLEYFAWQPMERKTGRTIPKLVRNMVNFLIYLLAGFGIIAFVYNQTLTGLLATSGVFAMVIGLAVKMNISDVVSGVVLSIERPFRINDWIKIDSLPPSKVLDMTWRSTRLISSNVITSIPNTLVSSAKIVNYNYPDNYFWESFDIDISPKYDPNRIKKILYDAVLSDSAVHRVKVLFSNVSNGVSTYSVRFYLSDFENRNKHKEQILEKVWVQLYRLDIKPYAPQQNIQILREKDELSEQIEEIPNARKLLNKVDVLHKLPDKVKDQLATQMQRRSFTENSTIAEKGAKSLFFYIVASGVVEMQNEAQDQNNQRKTMGEFFGEPSLSHYHYSAVAISKVQLYEIKEPILVNTLKQYPMVAEELREYLKEEHAVDLPLFQTLAQESLEQDEEDEDAHDEI